MLFEPTTGSLRYLRLGGEEVVRGIYGAVRDPNWNTVEPLVETVEIASRLRGFRIVFLARCRTREIDFSWQGVATGEASGRVRFEMIGTTNRAFLRNRVGLCVLHPASLAGRNCRVEHRDGGIERSSFPEFVSPIQPFRDMRAIVHRTRHSVDVRVDLEGEVFEMEDQRNWTDASFKIYSTPLSLPFPVEIEAGTEVRQAVTVSLEGPLHDVRVAPASGPVQLWVEPASQTRLSRFGLGMASHNSPLGARERRRLEVLKLDHLRVDLRLGRSGWKNALERAVEEARHLGVQLETALFLGKNVEPELEELATTLERLHPSIARWLVFEEGGGSARVSSIQSVRRILLPLAPGIPVGSGTDAFFAQLNRERPPAGELDFVCYSINPQVHAYDDLSLAESLDMQAITVESARRFSEDLPIAITPVTLKPRFNPAATRAEPPPEPGLLPPEVDARQGTLFGAGWTLGSLASLMGRWGRKPHLLRDQRLAGGHRVRGEPKAFRSLSPHSGNGLSHLSRAGRRAGVRRWSRARQPHE